MTGEAAKKALGESLDPAVAALTRDGGGNAAPKGKKPKGKAEAKKPKEKAVLDDSKKLMKVIKAFLA